MAQAASIWSKPARTWVEGAENWLARSGDQEDRSDAKDGSEDGDRPGTATIPWARACRIGGSSRAIPDSPSRATPLTLGVERGGGPGFPDRGRRPRASR